MNNEELDRPPVRRLVCFNAIGVLVALSSPLIIERYLTTLIIRFSPTVLWDGPWLVYAVLAAGLTGALTYLSLDRNRAGGRNDWVAPLSVMGPIIGLSFSFRWGNWPHMGMWCWAFAFGVLTHVFVVCRKARSMGAMNGNVEGLKATVTTWQMITVYGLTAYLAFVVFQLYLVWLISQDLVRSSHERLLFAACSATQLVVFSALIFMGPLREAWQMTFDSIVELSGQRRQDLALVKSDSTAVQPNGESANQPNVETTI